MRAVYVSRKLKADASNLVVFGSLYTLYTHTHTLEITSRLLGLVAVVWTTYADANFRTRRARKRVGKRQRKR